MYSCSLFFFTAAHFHLWPLAFLIFSMSPQIFHLVPPTKNVFSVFHLSLLLSFTLFLIELRWPVACMYFLFFSVFLFLCIPNCGHDNNINLSLILLDNTDTVVSASGETDGYVISRQNNL